MALKFVDFYSANLNTSNPALSGCFLYLGSGRRWGEGLVVAGEVAELVLNVVLE